MNENLKAILRGNKLNAYQFALANEEFNKMEKQIKELEDKGNKDCEYHLEVENQLQDEIKELKSALAKIKSTAEIDKFGKRSIYYLIAKQALKK